MRNNYKIYVGTYAKEEEAGIFCYRLAAGQRKMELQFSKAGIDNPSYLTVSEDKKFLYAVMETFEHCGQVGGGISAYRCDEDSLELLNRLGTKGTAPCHVLLDEKHGIVYVGNYKSGSLSVFALEKNGSLGGMSDFKQHQGKGQNPKRQEGPHVHFCGFSPEKDGIWCVDLGLDRMFYYETDFEKKTLAHNAARDIVFPGGSGPRHFIFNPKNNRMMYAVGELSCEVYAIEISASDSRILQQVSALEDAEQQNTCAAIKCSEDGRFLYVSNRGDDSIAVFAIDENTGLLERIQVMKSGGKNPRDLLVVEDMVLAAHQGSDNITVFYRDEKTGLLTREQEEISCHSPVCLVAVMD